MTNCRCGLAARRNDLPQNAEQRALRNSSLTLSAQLIQHSLIPCPASIANGASDESAEVMRTIAFVSQKGGSGKSTIASSLAVAAHEMKEKVCVVDMDSQGSLARWGEDRTPPTTSTSSPRERRACRRLPASLERKGVTLAILDTPGAEGAASLLRCGRRSQYRPFATQHVRHVGQRRTRTALRRSGPVRVPANHCPPAQTPPSPGRRRGARRNGRADRPLILARVDYQEAARHGRGVTSSIPSAQPPKRCATLAVHQPPVGAGEGRATGPRGGIGRIKSSRLALAKS